MLTTFGLGNLRKSPLQNRNISAVPVGRRSVNCWVNSTDKFQWFTNILPWLGTQTTSLLTIVLLQWLTQLPPEIHVRRGREKFDRKTIVWRTPGCFKLSFSIMNNRIISLFTEHHWGTRPHGNVVSIMHNTFPLLGTDTHFCYNTEKDRLCSISWNMLNF